MGILKYVLKSPAAVRISSLALQLSSQIEKACQRDSFSRFLLSTHRALIANLLLCRHSGTLIARRLRDKYSSLHSTLKTDSRLFVTQKVLLGGSLISFAQDKITDEEVLVTLKSFSTKGDSNNLENTNSFDTENDASKENQPPFTTQDPTQNPPCESWDPPLTLMIRQLLQNYAERKSVLLHPALESLTTEDSSSHPLDPNPQINEISSVNSFNTSLSSFFMNLDIQPDGTGFVDDSWELVFDRPNMHVWRKPAKVLLDDNENNSPKSSNKYEYRICGQFHDISASSFLEVQLNLDYRRHWDDKIVELDYITPSDVDSKDFSIIRWVVRFPFPLVNREYIYLRRWWIQPGECHLSIQKPPELSGEHKDKSAAPVVLCRSSTTEEAPSFGRYAYVISRCPSDFQNRCIQSSGISPVESSKKSSLWANAKRRDLVQVHEYHSEMLIESHGKFNQTGLNYYLIYYDDPCLPVNGSPMKFLSVKAMEEFMLQLHKAALRLHQNGLPPGIQPIVYFTDEIKNNQKSDVTPELKTSPPPKNKPSGNKKSKSYFFTDRPPSEPSYLDSPAAALY
ncbi:unnamed protein product [Trichobilharzia szidati]|nr:unnamed protein product [Trichobilharzia szidati]